MKFGHTLLTHQVPEWQQHYMDYKGLKKIVKAIHLKEIELRAEDANTDVFNDSQIKLDLARFFFHIDSNVEIVDDFYTKKYSDYEKRLKKIMAVFPTNNASTADLEEYDDLVDILLELRNCFRNLKWYAELNRRGFVKILKKLDKKAGTKKKDFYLQTKVYPLSFCNESELVKCLSLINDYLNILSTVHEINNHVIFPTKNMASTSSSSSISNLDINPAAANNPLLSTESLRLPPPSSMIINSKSNTKHSNLNIYLSSIYADDADQLESVLIKEYMSPVLAPIKLLLSLLNKSTLELSYKCIDLLLKIIPAFLDSSDVSGRSFIHHHVIALGKKNFNRISNDYNIGQLKKTDYNSSLFYTYGSDGINSNDFAKGLLYIFQNLPAHLKFAILQKDNYKRTPLHYASQYGLKEVTFIILKFLKEWGMYNEKISLDDVTYWGDSENLTPVHLAVLGKHPKTTQTLIDAIDENVSLTCPYLLHVATRMNTPGLLQCLLKCKGININGYESEQSKETALYVAAKYDLKDSAESLIKNGADTEIGEASFGWTPIFVAAAHGYVDIIDLLISNGAKYYIQDESGWTPREHAALRGHIDIVSKLTPPNFDPYESLESKLISPTLSPKLLVRNNSGSSIHRIPDIKRKTPEPQPEKIDLKQLKQGNSISTHFQSMSANKTIVGNRYLKKGESVILITIGTTDLRDITPAIELYKIPLSKIHSTELDSALSIVISPSNIPDQPSYPLALPLDDNHGSSTDPITFHLNGQDPLDTLIYFDIIPTFDVEMSDSKHKSKKVLGRAVAILKNMYTSVGPNKRSLFNCVKIPILEVNTLEVLGTIKFEILIVKSFEENGKIPADADIYWKSLVRPRLIGHRGNGMNSRNKKSLQLGENTVESFIAAASLGAQYVEFDVQLTKDDVPVVYHDFIIAESGIDIPMHLLTLEQFMHLNSGRDKAQSDRKKSFKDDSDIYKKSRSKSVSYRSESGSPINGFKSINDEINRNVGDDDEHEDINPNHERMKLTKTWKAKEFKANTRGSTIASSFTTLEELFKKVPKSAGFNIELKYPMLDESQIDDIGQTAPEMNHFCDKILSLVYEHYLGRNVIFSSFHPDICMIMTMKQPSFPVLFLTESGVNKMADIRASSLQNAIRFAKNWNLFGIVSDAVPFILCPRLASVVKASGLACFTYGSVNNDPENAKLEIAAGVDAVIVDSVLAVRKELTKYEETLKNLKLNE
jgi:glycerophosphoryl diester phosphodiesterase/ankyrin repeat protein